MLHLINEENIAIDEVEGSFSQYLRDTLILRSTLLYRAQADIRAHAYI